MNRKRSRVSKKPGRSTRPRVSPLVTLVKRPEQRTSRKTNRRTIPMTPVPTSTEVIVLDDTSDSVEILCNVEEKMGTFLKSGSFVSSDEEDEIKPPTFSESSKVDLTVTDSDLNQPSTSGGTSRTVESSSDDVMVIVDQILEKTNNKSDKNTLQDLKSLEDFRKETEEILKNASTLLDEFKTGRKAEPKPILEDSPAKGVGSCPICLDSLSKRQAASTFCGHIFCKECITQTVKILKKCPTCRKSLNMKKVHPLYF